MTTSRMSAGMTARIAGLLYLIVVAGGTLYLGYVPSKLFAADAATTVANLQASAPLYRIGIAAGALCYAAFVVLPLVLYRLLGPAGRNAAVLMVALAVVSVPISFAGVIHRLDLLSLSGMGGQATGLSLEQIHAQVKVSLDAYYNGLLVSELFWGLWLLPFGYLVFKSGSLPRIFGILLMLGCFAYLTDFFAQVLSPGYADTAFARYATMPASLGEIGTCLWLLIMGAREPRREALQQA